MEREVVLAKRMGVGFVFGGDVMAISKVEKNWSFESGQGCSTQIIQRPLHQYKREQIL